MKLFKYIFTLIVIVSTIQSTAQVYPVQVTVATTPPYYNYLSHYGDQNNHLLIVATLTDFNSPPVNVRLRLTIEGTGYKVQTRQDVPVGQVYTLSPGVPVFIQGDELYPLLLEQNLAVLSGSPNLNNLPEGITTICVEVVENGTGGAILSASNCTSFLLQLMQPPQPFSPVCNSVVDTTSMFQTFQWSQPQNYIPSIGSELNYTFSLYEWIDTNNYNIFQTGQGLVYTAQTTSPIVQVSNFDVAFQKGRKYVWRVRAQLYSNGLPTQMITQNGLSQPCSFYYGKPITVQEALADGLSINLSTQALTTRKGQAIWTVTDATPGQGLSTYSSYIVEYRKKTPEGSETVYPWSIDTVTALILPIYQLEPEQTYEVRVAGRSGNYTSEKTPISEFTTPAARVYACGESDLPYMPENYQPLSNLHIGDVVQIGQFPLNVTQATPLGTPGRFSGYGEVPHDFIGGAKVKVRFDNLLIDRDYVVREGVANAMTDGAEGWMHNYYLDHAFRDTVGFVTAYGYSGDSTSIFVVVDGDTLTYTFELPYPIVIYGEGNVAYQFWPDGTVTTTTWGTTPSNDQLDATKNFYVGFDAVEGSEQLFDKKQYDHFAANYEVIQCKEGFNYWVPNTAKGISGTTQVKATVHANTQGYLPANISFVVKGGYTTVPHTQVNDTTFILTLPAKSFDYQVYAMYEEFKIGKLNVMSYDSVIQKLHIVPLVALGNLTPSTIAQGLHNQYKASRLGFEVLIDSVFNTPEFTSTTIFANPDANLMEKYTAQMRSLREAFVNERELSSDEYVIFVIPRFENPEIDGYMVRGKGLGFVTAGTLGNSTAFIQTLAHELGHGIGGLEHSWGNDQSKKGATTNLLDYSGAQTKTLTRLQWDAMHDAPFTLSLFDDEEDAEAQSMQNAYSKTAGIPNANYTSIPEFALTDTTIFKSPNGLFFQFTKGQLVGLTDVYLLNGTVKHIMINGKSYEITTLKYEYDYVENGPSDKDTIVWELPVVVFLQTGQDSNRNPRTVTDITDKKYHTVSAVEGDVFIKNYVACSSVPEYVIGFSESTNQLQTSVPVCPEPQESVNCEPTEIAAIQPDHQTTINNALNQILLDAKNGDYTPFREIHPTQGYYLDLEEQLILKEKAKTLVKYDADVVVAYVLVENNQNAIYSQTLLDQLAQTALNANSAHFNGKKIAFYLCFSAAQQQDGWYTPNKTCFRQTFVLSDATINPSGLQPTELNNKATLFDAMLALFSKIKKPYKHHFFYEKYNGSFAYIETPLNQTIDKPDVIMATHLVSIHRQEFIALQEAAVRRYNGQTGLCYNEQEASAAESELKSKIPIWEAESMKMPQYWTEGEVDFTNIRESRRDAPRLMAEFKRETSFCTFCIDYCMATMPNYQVLSQLSVSDYYNFDYLERLVDPIVYNGLDLLGAIPGLDNVTDAIGLAYSSVRGNTENVVIYSAALVTPLVGSYAYKQGTKLVAYYTKKQGAEYLVEAKFTENVVADWVKISNDVPVEPKNFSSALEDLNLPQNKNKFTQQGLERAVNKAGNWITQRTNFWNDWIDKCFPEKNWSNTTFETFGKDYNTFKTANSVIDNEMRAMYNSTSDADNFLPGVVNSGITNPVKITVNQGDKFYKIVPKGNNINSPSPYYLSETEYQWIKANPGQLEQKLGLPLSSVNAEYDVFTITSKVNGNVLFQSTIAPTKQFANNTPSITYNTTGGRTQSLIINNGKSNLWDKSATPIETISPSSLPQI